MKKLKLNSTAFAGAEVLSRAQLKNVMGGNPPMTYATCEASCTQCPEGKRLKAENPSGWIAGGKCSGGCVAVDNVGTTCASGTSVPCSDGAATYCEAIPITI